MKMPVTSERKKLSRGIAAIVEERGDDCRVWFSSAGTLRHVLLGALQEKADFHGLVQKCEARIDPFVDGQAYVMKKSRVDDFLAAADHLVLTYVPEFSG